MKKKDFWLRSWDTDAGCGVWGVELQATHGFRIRVWGVGLGMAGWVIGIGIND